MCSSDLVAVRVVAVAVVDGKCDCGGLNRRCRKVEAFVSSYESIRARVQ